MFSSIGKGLGRKKLDTLYPNDTDHLVGVEFNLWKNALINSGFNILAEETYSFDDNKAKTNGDIDYIVEKDKIKYGIEIKNSLSYPRDLIRKLYICIELNLIPLFIVRWLSKAQFHNIFKKGGLIKIYEKAIFPKKHSRIATECEQILGTPLISLKKISKKPIKNLLKIHNYAVENHDKIKRKNKAFIKRMSN